MVPFLGAVKIRNLDRSGVYGYKEAGGRPPRLTTEISPRVLKLVHYNTTR